MRHKTVNETVNKHPIKLENLKKEVLSLTTKVEDLTNKLNDIIVTQTEESVLESTTIVMDMSLQTLIRVNRGWNCNYCDKVVKSDKDLKKHINFINGFKCDFCGQRGKNESEIENNWKEHNSYAYKGRYEKLE